MKTMTNAEPQKKAPNPRMCYQKQSFETQSDFTNAELLEFVLLDKGPRRGAILAKMRDDPRFRDGLSTLWNNEQKKSVLFQTFGFTEAELIDFALCGDGPQAEDIAAALSMSEPLKEYLKSLKIRLLLDDSCDWSSRYEDSEDKVKSGLFIDYSPTCAAIGETFLLEGYCESLDSLQLPNTLVCARIEHHLLAVQSIPTNRAFKLSLTVPTQLEPREDPYEIIVYCIKEGQNTSPLLETTLRLKITSILHRDKPSDIDMLPFPCSNSEMLESLESSTL